MPLPEPQTDCAADVPAIAEGIISSVSGTAAGTQGTQGVPEPELEFPTDTVPQEVSPTAPARQEQQPKEPAAASKDSTPQMGDTRMADGKKQSNQCESLGRLHHRGTGGLSAEQIFVKQAGNKKKQGRKPEYTCFLSCLMCLGFVYLFFFTSFSSTSYSPILAFLAREPSALK